MINLYLEQIHDDSPVTKKVIDSSLITAADLLIRTITPLVGLLTLASNSFAGPKISPNNWPFVTLLNMFTFGTFFWTERFLEKRVPACAGTKFSRRDPTPSAPKAKLR